MQNLQCNRVRLEKHPTKLITLTRKMVKKAPASIDKAIASNIIMGRDNTEGLTYKQILYLIQFCFYVEITEYHATLGEGAYW